MSSNSMQSTFFVSSLNFFKNLISRLVLEFLSKFSHVISKYNYQQITYNKRESNMVHLMVSRVGGGAFEVPPHVSHIIWYAMGD